MQQLQNLQIYMICLLAFAVPLPFIAGSVSMFALLLVWVISLFYNNPFPELWRKRFNWLWVLFFLQHAISYWYSRNKPESLFDIQVKLSFIILPLAIGSTAIGKKELERIFFAFVSGITATALFCIFRALWIYADKGLTTGFFYHALVDGFGANAVYMAWYTLFSISILLFHNWDTTLSKQKLAKNTLLIINIIFFTLLSSKTLILIFIIFLFPAFIVKKIRAAHVQIWKIGLIISAFAGVLALLALTQNPIKTRYREALNKDISYSLTRDYTGANQSEFNNLTLRIFLWRIGFENMRDCKLWYYGAGNGDVKDLQFMKMVEYDIDDILKEHHYYKPVFATANLHNMYIQSIMMLGIPGLLVFILIIFIPFFYLSSSFSNYSFLAFFSSSALFFSQEAALQTQAGSIYYVLFSSIFWSLYYASVKRPRLSQY